MDCFDGFKQIEDNSIDLVITDPPYGDDSSYGRNLKEIQNNENPLTNCRALVEIQRVLKNNKTCYNFTNWKHYPFLNEFVMRYTDFKIKNLVVCNKNNFGFGYPFRNKYELIMVLDKGNAEYNNNDFANVINFKNTDYDEQTHPHKKPVDIIRKILHHSSKEGDLVLDCFVGSGSIPVACKQLNRRFIGFEIDFNYFNQAVNRLSQNILSFDYESKSKIIDLGGIENEIKRTDFANNERQKDIQIE